METYFSLMPLAAVLVSLLAAVLIMLSSRWPNVRESWTVVAALAKFGITLSMLPDVLAGKYPQVALFTISPGISLALKVDTAGILFGLSASLLWVLTSFFSIGYVRGLHEHRQTRYFASFAICLSATMGIAFAANLFTFIIAYEVLTIATYPLVIHKETPEAIAAGRKYLAYLLTGGVVLLAAMAFTYQIAGSVDFRPGGFLSRQIGQDRLMVLFALFVFGFGVKSALMPLHSWLPSAMIAPAPVSALLHAVAVVKAGVFGLVRLIGFVMGPELVREIGGLDLLAGFAAATIVLASLLAFRQDNLKLRLAYSTIGHLSYIILGLSLLSPSAWSGGLLHIVSHAAMKITLFFCAGAIYVKTHRERVSELNGIGRQMPLTMAAFALASMGLAGMPPIAGFVSKWLLVQGTMEAGQIVLTAILLLSGLLNAGYLFPIVTRAFFAPSQHFSRYDEASPLMVVPLALTAVLSLFLGFFPNGIFHLYRLASTVAGSVLGGGGP
ncbi:MAG: monovalent cation/H+ antiporter subunit D family protein [Chloroflexota bacterium]